MLKKGLEDAVSDAAIDSFDYVNLDLQFESASFL